MPIPHTKSIANIQDNFFHGSKSVGVAEAQVVAASTPSNFGVLLKASAANGGIIYVGKAGVTINSDPTTDGFELSAGDGILIEVDNVNKIYAIASQAAQALYWVTL